MNEIEMTNKQITEAMNKMENTPEQVINANETTEQQLVIPVNFMCMTGNNDIDQKYWISAGRMAFLTPEQFDIFRMRLNDLIQTLDGFSRNGGN